MGPRHEGRGRLIFVLSSSVSRMSFNGATPRGAWKTELRLEVLPLRGGASMGPRHEGRGRPLATAGITYATVQLQWGHATRGVEDKKHRRHHGVNGSRFNGATPRGAWKTPSDSPIPCPLTGFNGATPRGAWKTVSLGTFLRLRSGLQWGHA